MTNFERIKNMSVEDLAVFIKNTANDFECGCSYCKFYLGGVCSGKSYPHDCMGGRIDWLNSEVEE